MLDVNALPAENDYLAIQSLFGNLKISTKSLRLESFKLYVKHVLALRIVNDFQVCASCCPDKLIISGGRSGHIMPTFSCFPSGHLLHVFTRFSP